VKLKQLFENELNQIGKAPDVMANRSFTRLAVGLAQGFGTVFQDGIYIYTSKSVTVTNQFLDFWIWMRHCKAWSF
jgi:hypothetical protein